MKKTRKKSRKSQFSVALVTGAVCLLSWIGLPTPHFPHPDAYAKGDKGGGGAGGGGGKGDGGKGGGGGGGGPRARRGVEPARAAARAGAGGADGWNW